MRLELINRLLIVLILIAASFAATASPSGAFDQYSATCPNDNYKGDAFSGSLWSLPFTGGGVPASHPPASDLRDVAENAHRSWTHNGPKMYDGSAAFKNSSVDTMTLVFNSLVGSGGVTLCALDQIRFAQSQTSQWATSDYSRFHSLVTHEWGHAWGLGHSGLYDNRQSTGAPTMATCISIAEGKWDRGSLSRDEVAGASLITHPKETHTIQVYGQQSETRSFHKVTPNEHFEHGGQYWAKKNVQVNKAFPGLNTPARLTIQTPSHSDNWIRNSVRIGNGDPTFNSDVSSDRSFAGMYVSDSASGNGGYVLVRHRYRAIRYDDITDTGCNFTGDDLNSVDLVGPWQTETKKCFPTAGWSFCSTKNRAQIAQRPFNWPYEALDSPDAVDAEIRVVNRTTGTNGYTSVFIDAATVYWDYED